MTMRTLLLVCAACSAPWHVDGQQILAGSDTAQIWTVALQTHFSTFEGLHNTDRLWLSGWHGPDVLRPLSSFVTARLQEAFPEAESVDPGDELFACPPGQQVRMPGRGCPIREAGRIVTFFAIATVEDGHVQTGVSVTRSAPDGSWTSMLTVILQLRREPSGWTVEKILDVART
ncbi:MAG: hypothetical protein RJQ04_12145 [Longimicrobiales bacterium]